RSFRWVRASGQKQRCGGRQLREPLRLIGDRRREVGIDAETPFGEDNRWIDEVSPRLRPELLAHSPATLPGTAAARCPVTDRSVTAPCASRYMFRVAAPGAVSRKSSAAVCPLTDHDRKPAAPDIPRRRQRNRERERGRNRGIDRGAAAAQHVRTDAARKRRVADDDSVRSGHIRRVQGMRPGRWNGRRPSLYGIRRAIAAADGQRGKDERANERSTDGHGVSPRRGGRDETAAEASQISALKPTISATGGAPSSFYCEIGEGSAVAVERRRTSSP